MSNATTISQSQISNDIRKQREKEINVVLGRFNRPIDSVQSSELNSNKVQHMTPPPAPPMPGNLWSKDRSADGKTHTKRKSNGLLTKRKMSSISFHSKNTFFVDLQKNYRNSLKKTIHWMRIRSESKSIHETHDCIPFCRTLSHRLPSQIVTIVQQLPCQRNKTIVTIEVTARKTGGIKLCSVFYFVFALIFELTFRC